jgi:hypothetical protein
MKKWSVSFLFLLLYHFTSAQFIDNFGMRIGMGLSNQYWSYENDQFSELSAWKDPMPGLMVYLNAEKDLNNYFSIRPEIGYIQKGFIDDVEFTDMNGEPIGTDKQSVILHDLSFDLATKIKPLQNAERLYLLAGFRGDFMLGYKDFEIDVQGETYGVYEQLLNDFNTFTLSGIIGIGVEIKSIAYIEFEYNPAITNNFKSDLITVRNRYFGITTGLNISTLIN